MPKRRRKNKLSPLKILIAKIRKTKEYLRWKLKIIKAQCPTYPKVKKFTQVHHLRHISKIIVENNITTVEEAIKCRALWTAKGVVMSRGEHMFIHRLERIKYPTAGFVKLLKEQSLRLSEALYAKT